MGARSEERSMGVMVVMTVPGDTAKFEAFAAANAAKVNEITESAKAAGCTGHRFAVGDGQVISVDYWDSAEHFQAFIASPELQAVMGEMGAQGAPTVVIANAKGFPGEF
jgi:heme-degrading monooxygenase HmoA